MKSITAACSAWVLALAGLSACADPVEEGTAEQTSAGAQAQGSQMSPDAATQAAIAAAVAFEGRPDQDRGRDAGRKPAEILAFSGITPGDSVADLVAGSGYYTMMISKLVGPDGYVYAVNTPWIVENLKVTHEAALALDANNSDFPNVDYLQQDLDALNLPNTVDAVFMALFYHDTVWQDTDRAAMNRAVFEALKPGGHFIVIDHHAPAGTGGNHAQDLHRVDRDLVVREIRDAGFELLAEGGMLANPDDDRTKIVFDPSIRGATDRFVLKFRKPA